MPADLLDLPMPWHVELSSDACRRSQSSETSQTALKAKMTSRTPEFSCGSEDTPCRICTCQVYKPATVEAQPRTDVRHAHAAIERLRCHG